MQDNFELIKPMLNFESDDDFYFVQILQRKKDNPGGVHGSVNKNRLVKAYYINSIDHLKSVKDEMILLAKCFNARVGINLNKRSYEKTAFNTLKKTAEVMHNRDYKKVYRAWNTSCGVHNGGDKIWLLDVDNIDLDYIQEVVGFVHSRKPEGDKVVGLIPSKNGYHLMVKGFDLRGFNEAFSDIEIHKNNPTNLFIP